MNAFFLPAKATKKEKAHFHHQQTHVSGPKSRKKEQNEENK